ncbi:MAG: DUF885 family protein [Sphingomonadales bacterium]|nr:DUF885 family protein [Sphingomonadales bacterium]
MSTLDFDFKNDREQTPLFFGRLPESAYEIRSFGLEQSLHRPPAMVQPAPSDFTEPSIFWLRAIPERCPSHLLLPLCLHEAWPGHLLQFSLAQENKVLPEFRRQTSLEYNAYIEGWALYCEKLGYDFGCMAMWTTDLASSFLILARGKVGCGYGYPLV